MTIDAHSEVSSTAAAQPAASRAARAYEPGNISVIRRIFQNYIRNQWVTFGAAVACMIVTSAASGTFPLIVDYTVKHLFIEKQSGSLAIIPLVVIGLMTIRAISWYGQQTLIDTVGERVVRATQRDMFDGLIRRDLASLNAVHSGQFVSTMLYDATLMRDAITRGAAGCAGGA